MALGLTQQPLQWAGGAASQAHISDFCGIFHLLEVFIQPVNNLQYTSILLCVHCLYSEA